MPQFLVGGAISGLVAAGAVRLKVLTPSGAWAACLVGTVLFAGGGWPWLVLIGAFFVSASALTFWTSPGEERSDRSTDRGGRRWDQVAANGGIATLAAAIHGLSGWPLGFAVAAGAVAAAAADTWGTETGRWSTLPPRLITSGTPVAKGTSGAVTVIGTVGELAGAVTVAIVATALAGLIAPHEMAPHRLFVATAVAGFSGALVDSVLGATIEDRVRWVDNSVVNLLATGWGAGVVLVASRWWR
jgi:uncharacterized protein (TIGR00297 family)